MYIKYQTVRNTFVGATAIVLAALGFVFTRESPAPQAPAQLNGVTAKDDLAARPRIPNATPTLVSSPKALAKVGVREAPAPVPAEPAVLVAEIDSSDIPWAKTDAPGSNSKPADRSELYRAAMRITESAVPSDGTGKDVLGPSSPWKLNLYDDDNNGQWDRGKLDYNRDDVDDEKWNFKDGRWERDGGQTIWSGSTWIPSGK